MLTRTLACAALVAQLLVSVNAFTPGTSFWLNTEHHASRTCSSLRMQSAASSSDISRRNLMKGLAGAVVTGLAQSASAEEKKKKKEKVVTLENGLAWVDKSKRDGMLAGLEAGVGKGDFVIVNYVAYLKDGTIFDNTVKRGKPVAFQVGKTQVIPGLEQGLIGMKAGEERQLFVPAKLAYGSRGVCLEGKGCLVPPDTDLVYEVTLVRVAPAPI